MRYCKALMPDKWRKRPISASAALVVGDFGFISAQLPYDRETGELIKDHSLAGEVNKVIDNLDEIMKKQGLDLSYIVKVTVYLTDLNQYEEMDKIYGKRFKEPYPARTCVEVTNLFDGAKVQMDAWFVDTKKYEKSETRHNQDYCENDSCGIIDK